MTADAEPRIDIAAHPKGLALRKFKDRSFIGWGVAATLIGLGTLVALVSELVFDGGHRVSWDFFVSFPSSDPAEAGILSAWVGSLLVILTTAMFAIPIGLLAGVYLEEYAPKGPVTSIIEVAVNNLAGVPSIIFGLLAVGLVCTSHGSWSIHIDGRRHACIADLAGCDRGDARSRAQRAAGNPPGRAGRRRHQMASDAAPRAAVCVAGCGHGHHYRHLARDRRNRAADSDRRVDLRRVSAGDVAGRREIHNHRRGR